MTIVPSALDETALCLHFQAGDRTAGDALLLLHATTIARTARRYRGRGVDDDDLRQALSVALLSAARRFEAGHGATLATYARKPMRAAANDAIGQLGFAVRLRRVDYRDRLARLRAGLQLPGEDQPAVYLDAPIGDGDRTAGDDLSSREPTPEAIAANREDVRAVVEIAAQLSRVHAAIIQRRYLAAVPETLEEIGASYGWTRENTRQHEAKALRIVRRRMTMREQMPARR